VPWQMCKIVVHLFQVISFTCVFVSTGPRSFLLYGQKNSLSRLLPDTDDCPDVVLPIHSVKNIKAVEFDPVSQYIYWVRTNLFTYFYVHFILIFMHVLYRKV
jgi:low density lipoprotein receptor-related protein 5/6